MISPISLGTWPTPLEAAPRLAARLDLDELWFKRDDLGGLGGGGNKVRKLQYTCAQAIAAGAGTVITSGAPQSNHARLTAAAAARLGLRCVLVITGKGRLGTGVLRARFLDWLAGPDLRDLVSGYSAAHIRHGGDGAFYVMLRRDKASR